MTARCRRRLPQLRPARLRVRTRNKPISSTAPAALRAAQNPHYRDSDPGPLRLDSGPCAAAHSRSSAWTKRSELQDFQVRRCPRVNRELAEAPRCPHTPDRSGVHTRPSQVYHPADCHASYKAAFKAASESALFITALSIEPAIAQCPLVSPSSVQAQRTLSRLHLDSCLSLVIVPISTEPCKF